MTLKSLRALAEKATQGKWEDCRGFVRAQNPSVAIFIEGKMEITTACQWVAECERGEGFLNPYGNSKFIAAANPAQVLKMIDVIEETRKALETLITFGGSIEERNIKTNALAAIDKLSEENQWSQ